MQKTLVKTGAFCWIQCVKSYLWQFVSSQLVPKLSQLESSDCCLWTFTEGPRNSPVSSRPISSHNWVSVPSRQNELRNTWPNEDYIYTTIKTVRVSVTEVGVAGWAWSTHA